METRAHYVLIGAFMLGGIILSILFTLWLGSVEREYDEYEIVFRQKISGLQEGANVLFNGIRVGEVAELKLDREDPNRSLALVQVETGTPVKSDTKVELELVGITGLAVVQFNGGSAQAPLLRSVDPSPIPSIEADLSGIAAVINSSGDIALNVQRLLSQENADSVSRILSDVEAFTDVIADRETEISLIIDNLAVASGSIRSAAASVEDAMEQLDLAATDVRVLIRDDGRAAVRELSNAVSELDALIASVNGIVTDNRPAVDAFAQQGLGGVVGLMTRADRAIETFEAILIEFDRDPARFILGEGRPTSE